MDSDDSAAVPDSGDRYDVAVVGGGPAGCAAGVFVARYGLDAVIFDRGKASLRRCAYLENYLGFPAGIDIDTMYDLMHEHAREAGCELVAEPVASIDRDDPDEPFAVETESGSAVAADRVIAATRYGGDYLRPLDDGEMFETYEHGGEERQLFDRDYADADGRTPIEGLYVSSPAGERDAQALVAAGRGAHVGRRVLADYRRDAGLPGRLAEHYDWLRPDAEFAGEKGDRDYWREQFDAQVPEDAPVSDERLADLRERYVDEVFETHVADDEVAERRAAGHRRLAAALDPEAAVAGIGPETALDAIDDDRIRDYLDSDDGDAGD